MRNKNQNSENQSKENQNYINEQIIEGYSGPIPFDKLNVLYQIVKNSICKIKYIGTGTGFFCNKIFKIYNFIINIFL